MRTSSRHNTRRVRRAVRRGFTLLEIMVVVTIIALLATLVAPRVWKQLAGSKTKAAQTEVKALANIIGLYMLDNGGSIDDDFELDALIEGDDPYLNGEDDIVDPWNRRYVVIIPGDKNPDFDVVSYGKDGEPGGEGENEDVFN
ncbi:MAG: type II secretion system protein GspG [Planctomycetota bacterium]